MKSVVFIGWFLGAVFGFGATALAYGHTINPAGSLFGVALTGGASVLLLVTVALK